MTEAARMYGTLVPESLLMSPEYRAWIKRERVALLDEFYTEGDPAGVAARAVVEATWPIIEEMFEPSLWEEGARDEFIIAVQRFVDDNLGICRMHLKNRKDAR